MRNISTKLLIFALGCGIAHAQTQVDVSRQTKNTGPDLNVAPGAVQVRGLWGKSVPSPSAGCFQYDGTNLIWGGCGGGGSTSIQTNGTPNGIQTTLNFLTSTTNAIGLVATPSNPIGTGNEKIDITGQVITAGIANTAVTTVKIGDAAVTFAKIQSATASSRLVGSGATGAGSPYTEITLGAGCSMTLNVLNCPGSGGSSAGGAGTVQVSDGASGFAAGHAVDNGSNFAITLPVVINSAGNGIAPVEAAAPSGVASSDILWADSTAHRWKMNNNNGGAITVDGLIAAGTATLGTSAISSGSCATVVTVAGTGIATTDVISWSFNGDVTAVTGYAPVTGGGLSLYVYPTSGNFNVKVCNPTGSSITPGAVTLNWRVAR